MLHPQKAPELGGWMDLDPYRKEITAGMAAWSVFILWNVCEQIPKTQKHPKSPISRFYVNRMPTCPSRACSRRRPGVLPKRLFSVSKLADDNSRHNRYYKPKRSLGFRPAKAIPRPPHNTRKHTIRPTPLRIRPPSAAPPWATAAGLTGPVT